MRATRLRELSLVVVSLALVLTLTINVAAAQDKAAFDADLQRAVQLTRTNRMLDALPILEKLYAVNTEHAALLETLAYALAVSSIPDASDVDRRKSNLLRARQLAEKSQKLGNNSQLVTLLLNQIPPDGNMALPAGSAKNPQAQAAMTAGESAFSKGDLQGAIDQYEKAFKLEPTLYEAPLFIGDAYFTMGKADLAAENYGKAIALDPDRDTAYRYWGDALLRTNKLNEAKEKFVEAVIAEPYSRDTWTFLSRWADKARVQLAHPRVELPRSSVTGGDGKPVTIQISPTDVKDKEDGSEAWLPYSIAKAAWRVEDNKRFKEAFPKELTYRHSLQEETAALGLVVAGIEERLKSGSLKETKLDVSIGNLLKVHRAGVLEAYILLAMPDEGLSKDYAEYRNKNRDKLRQYLNDFVTGNK